MKRTESQPASAGSNPRPWEVVGYRFSIGWPAGYECTAADSLAKESTARHAEAATKARAMNTKRGTGWRNGTMTPLSGPRIPNRVDSNPARRLARADRLAEREPATARTRADALRTGQRYYNTGQPCQAGHLANRYTHNGTCIVCAGRAKVRLDLEKRTGTPPPPKPKRDAKPKPAPRPKPDRPEAPLSFRTIARQAGEDRYSTGEPCSNGHVAMRFTRNATCVECERERKTRRVEAARRERKAAKW